MQSAVQVIFKTQPPFSLVFAILNFLLTSRKENIFTMKHETLLPAPSKGCQLDPKGMVNWHPLGTIWHPNWKVQVCISEYTFFMLRTNLQFLFPQGHSLNKHEPYKTLPGICSLTTIIHLWHLGVRVAFKAAFIDVGVGCILRYDMLVRVRFFESDVQYHPFAYRNERNLVNFDDW